MKTTISLSTPAEVETESLVVVVLDHAEPAPNVKEKDKKPQLKIATADSAVQSVAADLLGSGEVAGKAFETNLLHKPASLKAKRLLLISGGSAKNFSSYDLRRIAGVAVRALKARGIRSFAFVAPPSIPPEEAVRAIVEGAHVGNFDPIGRGNAGARIHSGIFRDDPTGHDGRLKLSVGPLDLRRARGAVVYQDNKRRSRDELGRVRGKGLLGNLLPLERRDRPRLQERIR